MALTEIQNPNKLSYPHHTNFPVWCVVSSTLVDSYFDFQYKIKIYDDTDTEVFTMKVSPDINSNGAFDVSKVVKSFVDYKLELLSTTGVYEYDDMMREYQIKVYEFYNNTEHNELVLDKNLVMDWAYLKESVFHKSLYYKPEKTDKYYTQREIGVEYTTADAGMGLLYYLNGDTTDVSTDVKGWEIRLFYEDGTYKYYRINDNKASITFDPTTGLTSLENIVIGIQNTLASWRGKTFILTNNNGTPTYSYQVINVENVKRYEMEPYDSSDTLIGDIFKYRVKCYRNNVYSLLWKNQYGVYDSYHFIGNNKMKYTNSKKSYNKNTNKIVSEKYYVEKWDGDSNRGLLDNENKQYIELKSGWLSKSEIEYIKTLIASNNVYLSKDNSGYLYPIYIEKSEIQEKTNPELYLLKLTAEYSKNIII